MSENAKVLVGIVVGIAVAIAALAVTGALWLRTKKGGIEQGVEQAVLDAESTAAIGDQWACAWDAYERSKGCGMWAPVCETKIGVFVRHCLERAAPGKDLCASVPGDHELLSSAEWAQTHCVSLSGRDAERCTQVFQTVQAFCLEHPTGLTKHSRTSTSSPAQGG